MGSSSSTERQPAPAAPLPPPGAQQWYTPHQMQTLLRGQVPDARSPYGAPPPPELQHTFTIRNDVNLKKATLQLVRAADGSFRIAFALDANKPCVVSVYVNAVEQVNDANVTLSLAQESGAPPAQVSFAAGLGQQFGGLNEAHAHASFVDVASVLRTHSPPPGRTFFPVVIVLHVPEAAAAVGSGAVQSQATYAAVEADSEGTLQLRTLKQKIQVDGRAYELQEIYGIDQRAAESGDVDAADCVICMSERRDTTVLPCRHMCLCKGCAQALRTQTNRCPVCRTRIESLLQFQIAPRSTSASTHAGGAGVVQH